MKGGHSLDLEPGPANVQVVPIHCQSGWARGNLNLRNWFSSSSLDPYSKMLCQLYSSSCSVEEVNSGAILLAVSLTQVNHFTIKAYVRLR